VGCGWKMKRISTYRPAVLYATCAPHAAAAACAACPLPRRAQTRWRGNAVAPLTLKKPADGAAHATPAHLTVHLVRCSATPSAPARMMWPFAAHPCLHNAALPPHDATRASHPAHAAHFIGCLFLSTYALAPPRSRRLPQHPVHTACLCPRGSAVRLRPHDAVAPPTSSAPLLTRLPLLMRQRRSPVLMRTRRHCRPCPCGNAACL
jgi:hypothetical protein